MIETWIIIIAFFVIAFIMYRTGKITKSIRMSAEETKQSSEELKKSINKKR